ncbi:hypothetical protein RI129_010064 [Pyrocoelia pectoralis]|uniref:Cytochrome P450 n=1 Tax=Pyrocoelia pectoralis TaxID=417401 RepID=A0AAN7V5Y8_9COLE
MWFIVLCVVLSALFYWKVVRNYSHWKNKGIPYIRPIYFFGNFASNIFRIKSLKTIVEEAYDAFPNKRYVGLYQFMKPILLVRDTELIKQITIKDFDVFPEHPPRVSARTDPLFGKNLFALPSKDGWHEMRATLSPVFSSGKMKVMFTLMEQCAVQFVDYFKQTQSNAQSNVSIELKDIFERFANDIIATTAFGITCDSLKDKKNEFFLMGQDVTNLNGIRALKFFGYAFSSFLMELLNVKIVSEKVGNFFRNVIKETIAFRKDKNIIRPDVVQILMKAREEGNKNSNAKRNHNVELSDEDVTSQALGFFAAGFGTVSSALSFLAYDLATHPEIQQKLYEEISTTLKTNSGDITYELVTSMKYLDCVISESLRMHAPLSFLDRMSVKPYTIHPKDSSEKPLHLEEGSVIWFPASSLHHDKKYFPNPDKFDPERFNEQNKHKINSYAYLPFGAGPRSCIASRFALLEMKLLILHLLERFELVPDAKTTIPLKLSITNITTIPSEGIWLSLKPRIKN